MNNEAPAGTRRGLTTSAGGLDDVVSAVTLALGYVVAKVPTARAIRRARAAIDEGRTTP